jgi:hypothetical protein
MSEGHLGHHTTICSPHCPPVIGCDINPMGHWIVQQALAPAGAAVRDFVQGVARR